MKGPIRTHLPSPGRLPRIRLSRPSTWWPSLATRQDEAFRNIWQALRQHEMVRQAPRLSEDWQRRAGSYVTCAVRVPITEEIARTLAPVRDALGTNPFVELLPMTSLTIVIQEIGFLVDEPSRPDEISHERLQEFCEQAEVPISDFPSFYVEIGGFNSFLDTPFLDVHDDGWFSRIHHRLRDFILLHVDDEFAYLPHIVLGYYTREHPIGSFPARMAPWRDQRFGSFMATTVDLLEYSTSDPLEPPKVLSSFELGHQRGAAETITSRGPTDVF